jgi:acetolactate synthase I/II/III large subunit
VTRMTGGEALVKMFQAHQIEIAFGMGGFQVLPYYNALAGQNQIRHVLIRDEKHGAFAADGYARVQNKPAIADATLGPGATNLVSGAAESFGASIPMILLTGEVSSMIAGRGATQESDQVGMLKPTCKASITVSKLERVPELVRRAHNIAVSGRPGPVNLNVPEEVCHGVHDFSEDEFHADPGSLAVFSRRPRPDATVVDSAAKLLRHAKNPLLLIGGGLHLSQAYGELERFVALTGMPVAYTISGKGALPDSHPLVAGLCGRYSRFANGLIKEADLLIVIGSKFGEIATNRWSIVNPVTKILHIDIDPEELGKVYRLELGIWADAKLALADLCAALPVEDGAIASRKEAQAAKVVLLRQNWLAMSQAQAASNEQPIHMARLFRELRQVLPADSIIVADGGFAAHWSALLYDITTSGRSYIANRGHAAIGYGLPGAIGAKLGAGRKPVVALCGDNGFAMTAVELETARRAGAPVIVVVVNNSALGYIKALQHALYDGRYISADFLDVNYAGIARAVGCEGLRVDDPNDLGRALQKALEMQADTPVLVDVRTTTDPAKMLPGIDARTEGAETRKN